MIAGELVGALDPYRDAIQAIRQGLVSSGG